MRVRLLSFFCRMWSCDDCAVSKCLRINDTFFTAEWMVRVEVK